MPSWRERLKALDGQPNLIKAAQFLRKRLPGDKQLGDPLSMGGTVVGQRLTDVAAERPSALREVGLSAFQVWQSVSEAQGRGHGHAEKAILFTDLVEFSDWALEAGDTQSWTCCARWARRPSPRSRTVAGRSSSAWATA